VYDRRIGGKDLTFGVSGKLHANSLIMYDHQTDSLWSHLVGAAVTGPMKGGKLNPRQSMFTQWGTWRKLYPESKILSSGRVPFFGMPSDPYESYYRNSDTGIISTRVTDNRIYPKEFVLGIVIGEKAKAYPFSVLSRKPIINDNFQGTPLLVVFDEGSTTGIIFNRKLGGKALSFKRSPDKNRKGILLLDNETGSVWEGLSGKAIRGKLKNKNLNILPMTPSFWFGWVDHYPDTKLFTRQR